ncbi:protein of unknown function DUF1555 [Opitutus terrae PB90-1]|uniref:Ice-binding protein C-terminal domain-containing protein n=1 Tax=Opitutus terrae (strain DSM 11246 / JCM 15787 / PB90-1) TaxID=452637 RepID=B1ZYZ1_OPITP|nr:protein of unknown function DUF1555 [Opitutus terrae PB90-1]
MLALALGGLGSATLSAQVDYRQANLVSDIPGLARHTDANLVNPWGISSGPTTPFWVSDADAGVSTLYNTEGQRIPLVVSIPKPGGGSAAPTGQVFNSSTAFNGNRFLFATEDGTIAGWRGALGTTAETLVDHTGDGASYKGLAIGATGGNDYLYAANFTQGRIDVVPATGAPALPGTFTDPTLPAGYAPFNIQNVGGSLFVSYAKVNEEGDEEEAGAGLGFVNRFDLNGNLVGRFASNGVLNAPWAVTMAPESFGPFGGDILVGNFGDGTINAFDPVTGDLLGTLKDSDGNPLVIEGLWGLQFGNGGLGGKTNTLYFAAGIDDETHGLFGSITPVPEPSTYAAFAALGLVACVAWRRRRQAHAAADSAADV